MQRPHGNAANECQDMERLAQYILRNPFSIAKMQVNRSGMNAKIKRNFQVFTACDFVTPTIAIIPTWIAAGSVAHEAMTAIRSGSS